MIDDDPFASDGSTYKLQLRRRLNRPETPDPVPAVVYPEDEFNAEPYAGRRLTHAEIEILRAMADGGRLNELFGSWVSYRLQPSVGDCRSVQRRHMRSLSRAGLIERAAENHGFNSYSVWRWNLTDVGRAVAAGTWSAAPN
ncbi:hypothetical protein [Rhodopseudomonas palustris]|uniref:hypothetical protein n=1 Tax=Rhodopseudomonas palustris TaxID=1076 RepID=UPI0021F3733C|nr:hypothetical protein [Rhodopseudomonas palustris]UYO55187.1 hypothetical protein KQX61_07230 [Rhodopseudomonas palustris]